MSSRANIFSIRASVPFAETLARGLIAKLGADPLALADATIYLPTRRAVRTLSETFARVLGGAALLPDIRPLGDVDEDDFLFDSSADAFDLPPAMAPARRRLLLAQLIRRWDAAREGNLTFAQCATLAASLAGLMDEVETQGADLAKLDDLVQGNLAAHWREVTGFLDIVREHWPAMLAEERATNPAEHRNRALRALARRLSDDPPSSPVIAAGSTGSIPATAELLKVIAGLDTGMVVLPGLDRVLGGAAWLSLDPGHAQYGMKQFLETIGVERAEVDDWTDPANPGRETFLGEAMRPAPTTDAWRARAENGALAFARGLDGLSLIDAAHPAEEAAAIALALREVLEQPTATAALVTPDRALARRVASELGRWGIDIDDSAGRPLTRTPVGAFLCLLAEAADAGFAPVPLLALLKHPLAAMGQSRSDFRYHVRALDRLCLRGPRPDPGLDGVTGAIERAFSDERRRGKHTIEQLQSWFPGVVETLKPLQEALAAREVEIATVLEAHVRVAEALAKEGTTPGTARLWTGSEGEAAAKLVVALAEAARGLPAIEASSYAPLIRTLCDEKSVRLPYGTHPRLSILGPLEARLQSFDLVVLGGLNEGTWPHVAPIDPWFSRPMRETLGLEQPERAIGLAAHDFATLASGKRVIVTRALKVDGTPTIASRWLQRIAQLARGVGADVARAPSYLDMARRLDEAGKPVPAPRPHPTPDVAARPRSLSVTEIETWLRDPYAIYARRILQLDKLDPLDAPVGPLERGNTMHAALEAFVSRIGTGLPEDAERELIALGDEVFARARIPKSALALWRPRFASAARWFLRLEEDRRAEILRSHVEIRGTLTVAAPGGDFVLRGRADRIDEWKDGTATIIDYKTGNPPSRKQVETMLAPQLPLEAAMLADGGFETVEPLKADELLYIQLSGGRKAGREVEIPKGGELAAEALARLVARIAAFDAESAPYVSRVMPFKATSVGDYDHLARVREWSLSGWEEDTW